MIATALYTASQVRSLDAAAIASHGVSGITLMQRAAAAAFAYLRRRWPQAQRIVVLCGAGNNGGDGYLLAALAHGEGLPVRVVSLPDSPPAGADAATAQRTWRDLHGDTLLFAGDLPDADVYVDALFGTGLSRPLTGAAAQLIEMLNRSGRPVLALDLPSGLSADSGQIQGIAVRADATISFVAHKRGLFTADALDYRGDLVLDTLDLPAALCTDSSPDARLIDANDLASWIVRRKYNVHKGSFGHVLAIGGDVGMAGAIRLASEAALRVGAGLVSVATRGEHVAAINSARPELMVRGIADAQALKAWLPQASVLAVGPGIGTSAWGHALWHIALHSGKPLVLDADGLNLLAAKPQPLPSITILTPHPGEAGRLLGATTEHIQRDRFAAARELAQRYAAVVVLKGAGSVIATPAGAVHVCPWGNPGMASGGMGDVLTGVIAGLLAQGLSAEIAACAGVALHAQAGDAAARNGERGLLASDLFAPLRRLANGLSADE